MPDEPSDLEQAVDEALTRMYAEAVPALDYQWAKENGDELDEDWYKQHYLAGDRQQEIVDEVSEKYELSTREHTSLVTEAILNMGPTNSEEAWEEAQE
jgi:hypothetical protein